MVIEDVLTPRELRDAHKACVALHDVETLARTPQDGAVRSDRVAWVEDDFASAPALRVALRRLRGVADELDTDEAGRGAWTGFDGDNARRGARRSRALGVPASGQLARRDPCVSTTFPHLLKNAFKRSRRGRDRAVRECRIAQWSVSHRLRHGRGGPIPALRRAPRRHAPRGELLAARGRGRGRAGRLRRARGSRSESNSSTRVELSL